MSEMRIGVIADTHGYFDPKVRNIFAGVDAILHGGDIGNMDVIRSLKEIAPVHAVRGNHEPDEVIEAFPDRQMQMTLGGKRFILSHGFITFDWSFFERMAPLYRDLFEKLHTDALIFGHSHFPQNRVYQGILFFCPGYAGENVREPGRAVGILTILGSPGGEISGEIIPL